MAPMDPSVIAAGSLYATVLAIVPLIEAISLAAGVAAAGAISATVHALRAWLRPRESRPAHVAVLEIDGEKYEVSGESVEDLERSIHERLTKAPSATSE